MIRPNGFTFLEMIISLVLISIVTVLSIPYGKKVIDDMRLRTTIDGIKNQLSAAKMLALANPNVPCGVFFDINSATQKTLIFLDQNGGTPYVYDEGIDSKYQSDIIISKSVTLSVPSESGIINNVIVFRGDGSAKNGGNIKIMNSSDDIRIINILPSTGRVKVLN